MASLFTPHPLPTLLHPLLFPTPSSSYDVLRRPLPLLSCHVRHLLDVLPQSGSPDGGANGIPTITEESREGLASAARGTNGEATRRGMSREANVMVLRQGRNRWARRRWRRGDDRHELGEGTGSEVEEMGWRGCLARTGQFEGHRQGRRWTRDMMRVQESGMSGNSAGGEDRGRGNVSKRAKRSKGSVQGGKLRAELDMCSKRGDDMGAIDLYDSAVKEGIRMGQHHYNVFLYLCSSAALGFVQQAKSGSTGSGIGSVGPACKQDSSSTESSGHLENGDVSEGHVQDQEGNKTNLFPSEQTDNSILISDEIREYARTRGFEIFEKMCSEKERVPMSEAALTAVARMAMSMGNGDMAFEIVKQMKELGITPKLRSYGPALTAFCDSGNIEKAFEVEAHMLESGVTPEETELEMLLRASVVTRRGNRVYYLLHKFRTTVRQVSPSTAKLFEAWFTSSTASKVGKRKWDECVVAKAIENNGGGWHGLGWLGRGKWTMARSQIDTDGVCVACEEKLAIIDLDPNETEDFATLVSKLALKREEFGLWELSGDLPWIAILLVLLGCGCSCDNNDTELKWLEKHGPFEAVMDAANVGLLSHRQLSLSKVHAVADGIQKMLPSRKWPLIVVHNKHLTRECMQKPANHKLVEKWKHADAIYPTPTGSNDDWYWLYAAIKYKCFIITNDEMRDHTFQLLEKDFFPKWKERHQVHFTFEDRGVTFQMPPPFSVVIQESEEGHWHIPVSEEGSLEGKRTWLCMARSISQA